MENTHMLNNKNGEEEEERKKNAFKYVLMYFSSFFHITLVMVLRKHAGV
jgi:hypothetical protein